MTEVVLKGGPEGARLVPAAKRHIIPFREGFNSGIAATTTRWHLPRSTQAMARSSRDYRRFAIENDGGVIGICGLYPPQFAGKELTIAIFDPLARGRGIGSFAVKTLCAVAFAEMKEYRVELGVYQDNAPAIRVYEKCGFRREALLRKYLWHDGGWRDLLWMSLLREDL